jgi:hypothetical protein
VHEAVSSVQNCTLLGCYAASNGDFLTDVSGQPIGPFLTPEDGTDRLSRNVDKKLPLLAAQ